MLRLKLPRGNFNLAVMNILYWSSGWSKARIVREVVRRGCKTCLGTTKAILSCTGATRRVHRRTLRVAPVQYTLGGHLPMDLQTLFASSPNHFWTFAALDTVEFEIITKLFRKGPCPVFFTVNNSDLFSAFFFGRCGT